MTTHHHLLVLLAACGAAAGCGESTTGRRVVLQTAAVTDLPADRTFVSNLGWTITVTHAQVATGALYYFEGPPPVIESAAAAGWVRRAIAWLSPIGTAHAHPGHYVPGRAMGQMLESSSLDMTGGAPSALPDGEGITGRYRSGTFSFADTGADPIALVNGVAVKGGETINFRATATFSEIVANAKDGQIVGSTFAETRVDGDGLVTATIHPAFWFTLVNFSGLPPGTPEAPTVLEPGTTPRIAFALGLAQIAAYSFAYTPNQEMP